MFCKEFLAKSSFMQTITQDAYSLCQPPNMCLQEGRSKTSLVQMACLESWSQTECDTSPAEFIYILSTLPG